jgi:DNA polymerase III alpha subunit (gram-positive type)
VGGKLKIIILALVILLAASLFIIFNIHSEKLKLEYTYNKTKQRLTQENTQLSGRLNSALTDNRSLQDRLEVIQKELEHISSERDELKQRYELIKKENEKLLSASGSYQELVSYKNENQLLKEQVDNLQRDNLALKAELDGFRQEKLKLRQRIEEAKHILKEKALLAGYVKEQEARVIPDSRMWSVDLPPIVVSPQVLSDEGVSSPLEGEILNINKEHNFVVIDLGQRMGVSEGMVFEVSRNEKSLGKIEVIQLREEIAACDIIQADRPFKIGDMVKH